MTVGRYVVGVALIICAFGPIGVGSYALRARYLPRVSHGAARIAEFVMATATVVCVAEVLGAVDLFRLAAVAPALAIAGLVEWGIGRRRVRASTGPEDPVVSVPQSTGSVIVVIVAVSVVAADWGSRTIDALNHGMTTPDTLWYHMPVAARFVQQGSITPLHYTQSDVSTVFYPATSELIHALGIMFMGNDLLSPVVNLGWGALALLAGWVIGRLYGVAHLTLTGIAIIMAVPGFVATQPGGAYDDIVGMALILSCVALLVVAFAERGHGHQTAAVVVAALPAGLAFGVKLNFIAPVVALSIGVWILSQRGHRLAVGLWWVLLVALTGSFWYLRNLIDVGNPIPLLHFRFGPISLPTPLLTAPTATVAHFLFSASAWREDFRPGLRLFFGPAWWAILVLAGFGLVLVLATGRDRTARVLAGVGLFAGIAYLLTPLYLTVLGAPTLFVTTIRYAVPAVVMGLVLLPLSPVFGRKGVSNWLLGVYLAILAVTQLDATIWPIRLFSPRWDPPIRGIDSWLGLVFGLIVLGVGLAIYDSRVRWVGWRSRSVSIVTAASVAIVGLIGGFGVQQFYLHNRYTTQSTSLQYPSLLLSWAQHVNGARIAVAGVYTQIQYGLYGRDLSNFVQYVGKSEPHGGYAPIVSCAQWRSALNEGHYTYVLTSTGPVTHRLGILRVPSTFAAWTNEDGASSLVAQEVMNYGSVAGGETGHEYFGFFLFHLHGHLDPRGCAPVST